MTFLFHLILFLLPNPALLSHEPSLSSESHRSSRDTESGQIKVVISEPCLQRDRSDQSEAKGQEVDLDPSSPLVLTHRIRVIPATTPGSCCQTEFATLSGRIERLEREVSELREKCGGAEGGCCTHQQSKGAGCTTVRPLTNECANHCSNQGRCVDGICVCFSGFSGPDCSITECPKGCTDKGKCINGKCVCDPGFTGPDCSSVQCPSNCNNKGRCVKGRCVCNPGFTGPDCSTVLCPGNCRNKGRCVNGQCVCDHGFTGPDCSERSCPGNCTNKGKCLKGRCVCEAGFTGPDCSERSCPGNCRNKGKCVNGQCVCEAGFTGPDCSERSCPGNCNNKGRCVKGRCVCEAGFTGPDCSERSCPGNCRNKGKCVNGQCVCEAGFAGPDCSERSCPGNCNNKGRCVKGKCVCDAGFTGPECSEQSCPGNCNNKGRCVNGQCVCNPGFTGPNCSEKSCPGNCNNKGRCVNGQCVCVAGFTGPDCSEQSCPGNCNNKGRCVNGQCVCVSGFTGPDCSEQSCPGNCNNKGRCVNGQCVCDAGFTGHDCAERSCPGNCNNKGRCVNGQCVCDAGFTSLDCSERSCPGDCNNKGSCVNGQCVCNPGFTGPDCSERLCPGNCNYMGRCVNGQCVCDAGFTGPDCSERSCPGNCNNKGRCVNGQCVCSPGFTGPDCSERSCPGNCNNKGRCVNGQCVCDAGFTGPDCSERSCPGNCNNKGRCVNGQCVCDAGFSGPDCSIKTCPNNCNNQGRCVNGKCVCDAGFTGPDCSTVQCPGNCNDRGRCVNGKCVCDAGFTGLDCSSKSCPNNCNNRGRCVNGQCVCDVAFTGEDCSTKSCPGNCNNRGRCVNGRCVCNHGFAEPDCSECQDGFTGPDCATPLSGVSRLSIRNITDTSVTLFWAPPAVQYTTYYITFTSEKDNDQKITATINGRFNIFTQRGLAAGQKYMVTVVGQKDGKRGAESTTRFQTLISGPRNLEVVKTSTTSVIVQWEQAQGEIDRYILTVSPNDTDGSGKGRQEVRLPPEQDSAQIDSLEPGRLYDISLVAEKWGTHSQSTTVQATPGTSGTFSMMTLETVNVQVPPGQDSALPKKAGQKVQTKPLRRAEDIRRTNVSSRPVQSRPIFKGKDKVLVRHDRPNGGVIRPNGTRVISVGGRFGQPGVKRPVIRYPRPNIPSVGSIQPSSKKEISGSKEPVDGQISNVSPTLPKNATENPSSSHFWTIMNGSVEDPGPESSGSFPETMEDPLEPTVTTERNLTAYINGTKCVRKVLVGHKIINGSIKGKVLSKNMTVIIGHMDGNGLLEKVITDNLEGPTDKAANEVDGTEQTPMADEHPQDWEPGFKAQSPVDDTPLPPLPFPTGRSRTQHQNTQYSNIDQLSRDRLPERTSLQDPPSSRYTTRTKPSGSSTKIIKGRPNGRPISSAPSSQNPRDQHLFRNVSVGQITLPQEVTASQIPGVQGTVDGALPENNLTVIESSTNTEKTNPKHEGSVQGSGRKEAIRKPVPPGHRIPHRGPFPPRPKNVSPFANRTRPVLKPPLHPYRNPLLRSKMAVNTTKQAISSILVKPVKIQSNANITTEKPPLEVYGKISPIYPTRQTSQAGIPVDKSPKDPLDMVPAKPSDVPPEDTNDQLIPRDNTPTREPFTPLQVEPEISGVVPNTLNPNRRPPLVLRRKDGTIVRPPPKHTQIKPKPGTAHTEGGRDPSAGALVKSPNLRPPFTVRRKNGTIVRPPPKRPTQIKPNPSTTHTGTKDSQPGIPSREYNKTTQEEPGANNETGVTPRVETLNALDVGEVSKNIVDTIQSRVTDGDDSTSDQKGSDFNLRPMYNVRINNGTINPNIQGGLPGSQDSINDSKHAKATERLEDDITHVGVNSITSNGFVVIWAAPKGLFKTFLLSIAEKTNEDVKTGDNGSQDDDDIPNIREDGVRLKVSRLLPGTARSYLVTDLSPQTGYHVSLIGKGPGLQSNIHTFIINTGPEPPSDLSFSDISESSIKISWKKPKSSVSGFKVTYTHTQEGEPISVIVDSSSSSFSLTKLSPGSSYEVSVISVLGLDESDPIKDLVKTLPDAPTDLRAINVTESKALLLWRPALATVDQYVISYGSEEAPGSEITVRVSGNAVEKQLQSLKSSTKYTVTIYSQLGEQRSSGTRTTFTTADGSKGKGEGPRDLKASKVTPRTATLSWKPPSSPVTGYKLTYFTEGGERKEVILGAGVTEHPLKGLHPSSNYMVQLQSEREGIYTTAITTNFMTGAVRYPYPTDCSQELLNGVTKSGVMEIFPRGKDDKSVTVYCDMETDGGGWLVFQRRKDGKTNFFRKWLDYRKGFGDLKGEFWLGNDLLHNLTMMMPMSMRVDLRLGQESVYAHYSSFSVDTMRKHYTVRLSGYSGTAGDSMKYHDGLPFSTYDRDPQPFITRCAMSYRGGWWYKNCHEANLNGLYNTHVNHQGVIWNSWKGMNFSIPFTEMKLRPATFRPHSQG